GLLRLIRELFRQLIALALRLIGELLPRGGLGARAVGSFGLACRRLLGLLGQLAHAVVRRLLRGLGVGARLRSIGERLLRRIAVALGRLLRCIGFARRGLLCLLGGLACTVGGRLLGRLGISTRTRCCFELTRRGLLRRVGLALGGLLRSIGIGARLRGGL